MNARVVAGRRVRAGLIGAGWWSGRIHLPELARNPEVDLVAIYDRNPDRAADAARRFGAPYATCDIAELLGRDLDVVVVASANHVHYEQAALFLDAGVDVLVEKPLTLDAEQAWDLVHRASRSGARLHVGYTFVHASLAGEIREHVRGGAIGDVVFSSVLFATGIQRLLRGEARIVNDVLSPYSPRTETWSKKELGGGQLHGQLTHGASTLLWMLDDHATEVAAFSANLDAEVDMVDSLSARMGAGGVATLGTSSTIVRHDERIEEYRIVGTQGHIELNTRDWSYRLVTGAEARTGQAADPAGLMAECELAPVRNLIAAAQGREQVRAPGVLGARTTSLLVAAQRAADNGSRERVVECAAAGVPEGVR